MATTCPAAAERSGGRLFYTVMGVAIALLVFAGYAQSYYLTHWVHPPARAPENLTSTRRSLGACLS